MGSIEKLFDQLHIQTYLRSIRVKLVLLSTGVFAAALIVLSAILYKGVIDAQQDGFDTALQHYAVDISGGFDVNFLGGLVLKREVIVEENKIFPFSLGQSIVQFRTLNGNVLLTSRRFERSLPISQPALTAVMKQGSVFETHFLGREPYRIINYLVQKESLPPLILQVAAPLTSVQQERQRLLPLIWILIPSALILAAVFGFLLSTRALKPVFRIIESAKAIKPDELSARVPVPEETELRELGLTLNDLLKRLESAFESQERFIADASHQLKTPLAILRGELDVFRKTERSAEETRELLTSISQETNQLSKMVDDLLLLARFDSGTWKPNFSKIRIDEALLETFAQLERLAKDQNVVLSLELDTEASGEDFEVTGDADLLKALFFNLIENAIKYSPKPGGHAHVELVSDRDRGVSVTVQDNGPGVPPEDLDRIFDRFYRGSRKQHLVSGVGLGLSIANRIAILHGASLKVETPAIGGTLFKLHVPRH